MSARWRLSDSSHILHSSLLILFLLSIPPYSFSFEQPSLCKEPAHKGACNSSLHRYYFDPNENDCASFRYSGCGGNENRFKRRSVCRKTCIGVSFLYKTTPTTRERRSTTEETTTIGTTIGTTISTTTSTLDSTTTEKGVTWGGYTPKESRRCTGCDPLYGVCRDGQCHCMDGFKKLNRICVDVDECEEGTSVCGDAVCINTYGGFKCECPDGQHCQIPSTTTTTTPSPPESSSSDSSTLPSSYSSSFPLSFSFSSSSPCHDSIDSNLETNCGLVIPRFYFDKGENTCRAVLYGGCSLRSTNIFNTRLACERSCVEQSHAYMKSHEEKKDVEVEMGTGGNSGTGNRTERTQMDSIQDVQKEETVQGQKELEKTEYTVGDGEKRVEYTVAEGEFTHKQLCAIPFAEVLREECTKAYWEERFYWHIENQECVPFWYDISCPAEETKGRNFFESSHNCSKCKNMQEELVPMNNKDDVDILYISSMEIDAVSSATTTTSDGTTTASQAVPTTTATDKNTGTLEIGNNYEIEEKSALLDNEPCSNTLHPQLEDDCNHEQWQKKWFYDAKRKNCRPFWYGGCSVDTANFYHDQEACRAACGHLIPVHLLPSSAIQPMTTTELPTSTSTTEESTTTTSEEDPSWTTPFTPIDVLITTQTTEGTTEEEIKALPTHIPYSINDTIRRRNKSQNRHRPTIRPLKTTTLKLLEAKNSTESPGELQIEETAPTTEAYSDPCTDPIDRVFEKECTTDWVPRASFHPMKGDCVKFWYGGCDSPSRNIFPDVQTCRTICAHRITTPGTPPYQQPRRVVSAMTHSPSTSSSPATPNPPLTTERPPADQPQSAQNPPVIQPTTDHKHTIHLRGLTVTVRARQTTVSVAERAHEEAVIDSWPWKECLEEHRPRQGCGKQGANWTNRYYFDHSARACRMYWGCGPAESGNDFADQQTCSWKCEEERHNPTIQNCLDPIDPRLEDDCRAGQFEMRWHFDFDTKQCVSFQYGGCRSKTKNIFLELSHCVNTCKAPITIRLAQSCLEPFDRGYLNTCTVNGRFEPRYKYDSTKGRCEMFWWGGCRRQADNFFPSLATCTWSCERTTRKLPKKCSDPFDNRYMESCGQSEWKEFFYYDHETATCTPFWYDGCTAESQNIFEDKAHCEDSCEGKALAVERGDPPTEESRCLEPMQIGNCKEAYPVYYYDKQRRHCRPFAYSGCGGNGNRFLTISQCERLCEPFHTLSETEMNCYLPLDTGHSESEECALEAAVSFFYDRVSGQCEELWYHGCGGNANRFPTHGACASACQRKNPSRERPPRSTHDCFEPPAQRGYCNQTLERYTYKGGRCGAFKYSGCGGNNNRFSSLEECRVTCKGLRMSNTPAKCSYDADWGRCNQLQYEWFFNQSTGLCQQFLYGGCGGNTNRFHNFTQCQKTCELSGLDPCNVELDRTDKCHDDRTTFLLKRWYYVKKENSCKIYNFLSCVVSEEVDKSFVFLTKEECDARCLPLKQTRSIDKPMGRKRIKGKKGKKEEQTGGYKHSEPPSLQPLTEHIRLNRTRPYHVVQPTWIHHTFCIAYRFNVTGETTRLESHLCAKKSSPDCWSEVVKDTSGEEFCHIIRPFLAGSHLYTWFFSVNKGEAMIIPIRPGPCHQIC